MKNFIYTKDYLHRIKKRIYTDIDSVNAVNLIGLDPWQIGNNMEEYEEWNNTGTIKWRSEPKVKSLRRECYIFIKSGEHNCQR